MLVRTILTLITLASILTLSACGYTYKKQSDCNFVQNVYGERISWKANLPITLYVHESVPHEFYEAIEDSIAAWEEAAGRPVFKIAEWGVAGPLLPRQDRVNMIYWMDTWEDQKKSEQARTSVYWIGDEIKESDIRVNAAGFKYFTQQARTTDEVHLPSLMIHELGHVLGLKHNDSGSSVMATYLAAAVYRDRVNPADADALLCEYN
jgi:hypothetical protein